MIRVSILGRPTVGRFYYRIDTPGTRLAVPFHGLSAVPLADACGNLRNMRAAKDGDVVGLFASPESDECKQTARIGWVDPLTATVEDILNDGKPGKSEEQQPQQSKSQEPQSAMGQGESGSGKTALSPRKRKQAISSGRRGRR